jgi:hypothetical protein
MVLRGQVQMALGMPSVKMSGGSGMGWAWLRATRRAVQAAMAAMAASRMSSTAAEDDPGLGEQAASADRPGPGALALVERAAGEGGEADLGVNLDHSRAGVADPGVDLKQLVPERERLRGHAAPVASCLTAVALAWSGASSAGRTGVIKTDRRRRASWSARRYPASGRPMGISIAKTWIGPSACAAATSSPMWIAV